MKPKNLFTVVALGLVGISLGVSNVTATVEGGNLGILCPKGEYNPGMAQVVNGFMLFDGRYYSVTENGKRLTGTANGFTGETVEDGCGIRVSSKDGLTAGAAAVELDR